MELKLGLDIGIASVGWGIIDENYNIIDAGVRLFSENSADGNEGRRTKRSTRRRIRRLQFRLQRMEQVLVKALAIEKPHNLGNIYEIRCRGVEQKISKQELFASIMHLAKRRGTHFLTAEDYEIQNDSKNAKTNEEILKEQDEKLNSSFVCQIQYEKFLQTGQVRGTENRFRNKEYKKELEALLKVQADYYPEIKDISEKIMKLYNSKREYFDGPGSENSPTPYGRFRKDKDGQIIEVNLIEMMRGRCTFFPDELRIARNAYSACIFNLLNDLNNMTVGGQPISYEQKRQLVGKYINEGNNISLLAISKVTGVKREEIRGYRIDKDDKAIFTEFTGYKDILKALRKENIKEEFIKGNSKLVDEITEILTKEKNVDKRYLELLKANIQPEVAEVLKKLSSFTQYHSLSKKAIDMILEDLWETNENQMQLFKKAGVFQKKQAKLYGVKIPFEGKDLIISPIAKRAMNEAVKIVNEARSMVRKKYNTEFKEIVIEMAREKNSEEKNSFIKKMQKANEKLGKDIRELIENRKINQKQFNLLRLLIEQDFHCAYSGKKIDKNQVINNEDYLEIDHIIPLSISFDDSLSNKVAVLTTENRAKKQKTPYQYLKTGRGQQSYEEYKAWVLKRYDKNKKKRENLLYEAERV